MPETKNGHIFSGIVTFVDTYDRLAQMPKTKTILKSVTGNTQGAATIQVRYPVLIIHSWSHLV